MKSNCLSCMQDKEDDMKVGVKSTALRFGDSTKEWVTGFGIACISSLALSGFHANIGIDLDFVSCLVLLWLNGVGLYSLYLSGWSRMAILRIFGSCLWSTSMADFYG